MTALKNLSALMHINGRQARVIARTTYADMVAMTGLARDYIGETANPHEVGWLMKLPENALFHFANEWCPHERPLRVPDERLYYRSARDKRAAIAARKAADEERSAAWAERHRAEVRTSEAERRERVARVLYGFDRHNEEWGSAQGRTRETYLERADAVLGAAG